MTPVVVALCSVSAFLGLPLLAAAVMRWSAATRPIYGACFVVCLVILVVALTQLMSAGSTASALSLPLGLPWVGAHFQIDALAAFFLAVVNLGGAIWFAADRLSHLQFLTIRKYLSLVFALLVILLFFLMLVMLVWS